VSASKLHTSTHSIERSANFHTSFIAVKPDGVQRGLVGDIISRFEKRGYKLVALKMVSPTKEHLEKHYEDLSEKPFFKGLVTCENETAMRLLQRTNIGIRHAQRPHCRHGLGRS
jgi:hypothetical protein